MSPLERWERRTRLPLLVLALLFAAAYAAPILLPHADPRLAAAARALEWTAWGCYAADYAVRLALSGQRWAFVRSQPLALAAVVLPLLQPLRLLRLLATLLLAGQRVRATPQVRLTTYVVGSVLALLLFGSLAVLEVERQSPHGNIRTMDDALWWAFTTMTTVGYGEHYPTTGVGRLIAVCLMLSGIALLGVVTANIAAWFIAEFQEEEQETRRQQQTLDALVGEVRALREQVALLTLRAVPGGPPPGDAPAAPPPAPADPADGPGPADLPPVPADRPSA
ncbi:potassium channel family protein [Streptacidiphilus sp. ASG 303]|uniref:potassium channel family protein n=1 Tax=Streptacidiphilus sp. ASG 303 TaxID=2896847 RepID=UPI001E56E0BF|nr:potassium channel family protein [Streptacidiphilus sp. ASG 303]MCD0484203.1 potassium channel family protein [Streptacidiphilus sp. ASG 303]